MKLTAESTIFNDDKVQSKFTELVVDADGIRTEVSKKVGNTEIISRINQSAESVKIQADKIDITGTTTFSDGTSINSIAKDAADGVEVGGRNLLIENGKFTEPSASFSNHTLTNTATDTKTYFQLQLQNMNSSRSYVNSFTSEYKEYTSTGHKIWTFEVTNTTQNNGYIRFKHNGSSHDVGVNFKFGKQLLAGDIVTISFDLDGYNPSTIGGLIIKNIKLEKGNKATDWTPAPEDVQTEIDAKKSVHTLMSSTGGSTYANILSWTAEGRANTSWDINTTATPITNIKVGDTVRVAYKVTDMNNAYVYVIGEFKSSSGSTVYLTMHGLDTTIIDGGNILTNSIGANKIKVNELTIGQTQVSGLSTDLANTKKLYKHDVDLTSSSYNQDTWYPVLIGPSSETDASIYFKCSIINGGGTPSWSLHSSKHWACEVEASYSVSRWGWKPDNNSYIDAYTFGQTSTKPIVLSNELSTTAYLVVYLRGGGYYPIQTNIADTPQIKTSSYTIDSRTVTPTTTQPVNTANFVISRREGDTKTNEAATTATNYLYADSNGLRIANANPSTQWQRIHLTASDIKMYDSSNYQRLLMSGSAGVVVGRTDKGHTVVTDDGLSIYDVTNKKRSEVTKNGLNVLDTDGSTSVASFGATARIGKEASGHASIKSDGLHVWTDTESIATNEVAFFGATARVGKSNTRHIEIKDGGIQIYQDADVQMGHFGYGPGNNRSNGTSTAPYFTLGKRGTTITTVGNYSVAEGDCAIASGYSSHAEGSWVYINTAGSYGSAGTYYPTASDVGAHAEGEGTLASDSAAHAEGVLTIASGYASHAEGKMTIASTDGAHAEGVKTSASGTNGSHAEGFTTVASGEHAHAEGAFTTASGDSSHAGGYRTTATRNYQTVIGKYNSLTGSGTTSSPYVSTNAAFIVGGGVTTTGKDLFYVDWSGNVAVNGTTVHSSDRRLKQHISYLGKEAISFVHKLKPVYFKKDNKNHVGFYAQDIKEVDKWNCMTGEMNGYMTLNYIEIIAPLVAYCQHLEKRIEELEGEK